MCETSKKLFAQTRSLSHIWDCKYESLKYCNTVYVQYYSNTINQFSFYFKTNILELRVLMSQALRNEEDETPYFCTNLEISVIVNQ